MVSLSSLKRISNILRDLGPSELLVREARHKLRNYVLASIKEAQASMRTLEARYRWENRLIRKKPEKKAPLGAYEALPSPIPPAKKPEAPPAYYDLVQSYRIVPKRTGVYVDTVVFLNVLRQERSFLRGSLRLFELTSSHKLYGITSQFTVFEIVSILSDRDYTEEVMQQLDEWAVERVPIGLDVAKAIPIVKREVHDKDDLIHAGTAFAKHVAVFVTRDLSNYEELERKGRFCVWTPEHTVDQFAITSRD